MKAIRTITLTFGFQSQYNLVNIGSRRYWRPTSQMPSPTSLTCHQNISSPTSMYLVIHVVFLMLVSQVFEIMDCLSMRHRIMKRSGTLELLTFSIFAEGQTKEFCLYGDFIEEEICFTQFTSRCAFNCKLLLKCIFV